MKRALLYTGLLACACAGRGDCGVALSDFAIFAGNDVELDLVGEVVGDVYAGDDARLIFGDVTGGDLYAGGDVLLSGIAQVGGDVFANGVVEVGQFAQVTGQIVSGPGSTPAIPPPSLPGFPIGTTDVLSIDDSDPAVIDLAPGRYGDLFLGGFAESLRLTSGDYFFDSFVLDDIVDVELTISGGQPIRVFARGDIVLEGLFGLTVNGVEIDSFTPAPTRALAAKVLFASLGDVDLGASSLTAVFGTMWGVDDVVGSGEVYGTIIAGRDVRTDALDFVEHIASESGLLQLAALPGDYNADGVVNGLDYDLWASTLGSTSDLRADGNGNNVVDTGDYTVWRDANAAASVAVPEPNSAALIGLVALVLGARKPRRRRSCRATRRGGW